MSALPAQTQQQDRLTEPLFLAGDDISQTEGFTRLSFNDLVQLAQNPSVGPKLKAGWFAPFVAESKTKAAAEKGQFNGLVLDHDSDNRDLWDLSSLYDEFGIERLIYSTSSHMQTDERHPEPLQRWKVIIPFSRSISAEQFSVLAVGAALLTKTDPAQVRIQQVTFCPNKLTGTAPFEVAEPTGAPLLDPLDDSHPFVIAAQGKFREHEEQQRRKAEAAALKPRSVGATQGGIIDKFNAAYSPEDVLEQHGYERRGRAYLSPYSTSGVPGVYVLQSPDGKRRAFSHHGKADPISGQNHTGPDGSPCALDAFALFTELEHGGNVTNAVAAAADLVDEDANKERRREYMREIEREQAAREFEHLQDTPEPSQSADVDLLTPPGIAGDICQLMGMKARRDRPELYPLAALQLLALASSNRGSVYTDKFNLITLGIASTGAGKENPQDVIKALAREAWLSEKVSAEPGSFRDMIYALIEGDGTNLYIVDELHSLLQAMKGKNANSYESKIEAEILKMTTTGLYTFRSMEKRQVIPNLKRDLKDVEKQLEDMSEEDALTERGLMLIRTRDKLTRHIDYIEHGWPNPFCSIMGHSVPERLDKFASDPEAIAGGFIGRSLVVRCPEGRERLNLQRDSKAAAHLEHELSERLRRVKGQTGTIQAHPDADAFLMERIDYYDQEERRNNEYLGAIYARAPEQLLKVASILAVETGTITLEHARYADALVNASVKDVRYLLTQAMAQGEAAADGAVIEHARLKILKQCKGQGMAPSRLQETVTRSKEWDAMQKRDVTRDRLQELLTGMIERGELELVQEGRRSRYRSKAVI